MRKRNGWTLVELLIAVVCVAVVGFWIYSIFGNDPDKPAQVSAKGDVLPGQIHIVCVEGHEYLYIQSRYEGFARAVMAPRFDDEGKPRKCRAEVSQ